MAPKNNWIFVVPEHFELKISRINGEIHVFKQFELSKKGVMWLNNFPAVANFG